MLCVDQNDPDYGCGAFTKTWCNSSVNAQWSCSNGSCAVAKCDPGWADCNMLPGDGCETDLGTPSNCGGCNMPCPGQKCAPTGCVPSCVPPLSDCSGSCANLATSPQHCGKCSVQCSPVPHGHPVCNIGVCDFVCDPGFVKGNGTCWDPAKNDRHCCGAGCADCTVGGPTGGVNLCVAGQCTATCPPGTSLCNGACVDTATDPSNCGGCGAPCNGVCQGGSCNGAFTSLVALVNNPVDLQSDGSNLYWIQGNDIVSVSVNGGVPMPLAASQPKPSHLLVSGGYAYWGNVLGASILRVPAPAGGMPQLVSAATQPDRMTIDGAYIYWDDAGNNQILRAPIGGGASSLVATYSDAGVSHAMAGDGTYLYWGNGNASGYLKATLEDGSGPILTLQSIAAVSNWASNLVEVGPYLLVREWHDSGAQIESWQQVGSYQTVLQPNPGVEFPGANTFLVNGDYLYYDPHPFLDMITRTVDRVAVCGGLKSPVPRPWPNYPSAIDGAYLYWVLSGAIYRTPKPT